MLNKKFLKLIEAKEYEEKFRRIKYPLQQDEKIVQCKEPYPSYWFVSNMGYVLSVHGKKLKKLKTMWNPTAKQWVVEYRPEGAKYNKKVIIWQIVADHFCEDEFSDLDVKKNVHHKNPRKNFTSDQSEECNRADNLQILPEEEVHKAITHTFGKKTQEEIDSEIMNSGAVIIPTKITNEQEFVDKLMELCGQAIVYSPDVDEDGNITCEAHVVRYDPSANSSI